MNTTGAAVSGTTNKPADSSDHEPDIAMSKCTAKRFPRNRGAPMIDPDEDMLIRLTFDLRQVWRGDWTGPVMILLRRGQMQYRDIRDEMADYTFYDPWTRKHRALSSSELARCLVRMTKDGWLIRTETPGEWHSNVSYALSDAGEEAVAGLVAGPLRWSQHNSAFFARARERRSQTPGSDRSSSGPHQPFHRSRHDGNAAAAG